MTVSSKKSIFGKFINLLSGKPEDDEDTEPTAAKAEPKSEYAPKESEPIDLTFVKNFVRSEGKFLYCENKDQAAHFLNLIREESGLSKIFCQDDLLVHLLKQAGLTVTPSLAKADAFCSSCEYLVSFNGGIMLTAKQTKDRKLTELPETFITVANTSQITSNLRSALSGIRAKYQGDIPSQITTIRGPKKLDDIEDRAGSKMCNKEIYLLLLEDQD